MIAEKYDKLADEEKRIKVATLCGWRRRPGSGLGAEERWVNVHDDRAVYHTELPDYLNDLNACHGMESLLDDDQLINYVDILKDIAGIYSTALVTVTAEQKCMAFVLAMEPEASTTVHINTGCNYDEHGQRISIEFFKSGSAIMVDHARGLHYLYKAKTVREVMHDYLKNRNIDIGDFAQYYDRVNELRKFNNDTTVFTDWNTKYRNLYESGI